MYIPYTRSYNALHKGFLQYGGGENVKPLLQSGTFFTLLKHVPSSVCAGLSVEGEEVHTRWMWLELGV